MSVEGEGNLTRIAALRTGKGCDTTTLHPERFVTLHPMVQCLRAPLHHRSLVPGPFVTWAIGASERATRIPLGQGIRATGRQSPSGWLNLDRAVSGLFSLSAPGKISAMTPDFGPARTKLKRIRLKKYAPKGTIIGPNPR